MNHNVLVAFNKNDNTAYATFSFEDIPDEEVKLYGDVVATVNNWGFSIELENKVYSSEDSIPLCLYIQLLEDRAVVCELRRDNSAKYFLCFA